MECEEGFGTEVGDYGVGGAAAPESVAQDPLRHPEELLQGVCARRNPRVVEAVEEVVAVTLGAADHAVDEVGGGAGEAGAWDVCEFGEVSVPASPRCGSRGRTVGPVGRGRQLVREAANDLGVAPDPTRRACLVPRRRQSGVQLGD